VYNYTKRKKALSLRRHYPVQVLRDFLSLKLPPDSTSSTHKGVVLTGTDADTPGA